MERLTLDDTIKALRCVASQDNIYLVQRKNGNVIVSIMRNKSDGTYSFVNLTKNHICPCRFDSVEDAVKDMDKKILNGEIIGYFKLEEMKNER